MRFIRRPYVPGGLSHPAPAPAPAYSRTARRTYGSGQPLAALRAEVDLAPVAASPAREPTPQVARSLAA